MADRGFPQVRVGRALRNLDQFLSGRWRIDVGEVAKDHFLRIHILTRAGNLGGGGPRFHLRRWLLRRRGGLRKVLYRCPCSKSDDNREHSLHGDSLGPEGSRSPSQL